MYNFFIEYCLKEFEKNNILNLSSIIAVIGLWITIIFYILDKYINSKANLEKYVNRLLSLKFELNKNKEVISKWIQEMSNDLNLGTKLVYFRYDTRVLENIIITGDLLDSKILRNLDSILTSQKQINIILDGVLNMGEMSHAESNEMAQLFKGRIISSSQLVIKLSNDLKAYYPRVVNEIDEYILRQKNKRFLFIIKYNLDIKNKEIEEGFWRDNYLR